jgi:hypothetical protein
MVVFGKFATSQRADVGIGPYNACMHGGRFLT